LLCPYSFESGVSLLFVFRQGTTISSLPFFSKLEKKATPEGAKQEGKKHYKSTTTRYSNNFPVSALLNKAWFLLYGDNYKVDPGYSGTIKISSSSCPTIAAPDTTVP
jgi:hypothetical protein